METDQILDLFDTGPSGPSTSSASTSTLALPPPGGANNSANGIDIDKADETEHVDATTGQVKEKGKKGWMDDLDELWDARGYEEEFDLGGFMRSMKM